MPMLPILLSALLGATPAPSKLEPVPPHQALSKSLSFVSQRIPFRWDATIPLDIEVDGLKVTSIFFNRKEFKGGFFKGTDFGIRAQLEVANHSKHPKMPGFAIAVFDANNQLLGASNGSTRYGTLQPGMTDVADVSFRQVKERLPKGDTFILSIELSEE